MRKMKMVFNNRLSLLTRALTMLSAIFICLLSESEGNERSSATSQWGANYFPDYSLTNHRGESVRFFSDLIKDKVVVINFIYTSCPDACPLETSRLRETYALLADRAGKDVFFYSITIDPDNDTVPVLKDYAERWDVGSGWDFLTGKEEEITHLRKKLGLLSDSTALEDHQVNMIMGNQRTGRWIHRTPFETATVLAEHLGSWLHNYKFKKVGNDYAEAPEIRKLSDGEYLFRTRCASCHTIGLRPSTLQSAPAVGPDLLGVGVRRDEDWLVRWICEPDVMIAEGDELALSLLKAYNNIPMPNLQLREADAKNLLRYIADETNRFLKATNHKQKGPTTAKVDVEGKVACPNCEKRKGPILKKWIPQRKGLVIH